MRVLISIAAACLLSASALVACGTPNTGGGAGSPIVTQVTDEKALYTAELAFKGGRVLIEAAVDSGQLKGNDALEAQKILRTSKAALDAARVAYAAADAVTAARKIREAETALYGLDALLKPD
jgi:hypothetical protein